MNYDFLFRISICFLLSFVIGIERQYRKRMVGLRTSILVAVGSFLFVTFSVTVGAHDISRIASCVVTGMGFLGAGVILKDGGKIRGLTTAATIWCDAAIGVLCAGGAVFEASVGTFIILFSNIFLRYINILINNISSKNDIRYEFNLNITGYSKSVNNLKNELDKYFNDSGIEIKSFSITKDVMESNLNYNILMKRNKLSKIENIENIITKNKIKSFSLNKLGEIKLDEFDD